MEFIKLKIQLEWKDYLNTTLLHIRPTRPGRVLFFISVTLISLSIVMSLGQLFNGLGSPYPFFILIFLALFYVLYRYVLLPRRIKKIFAQQKSLQIPFEVEISKGTIKISNENGSNSNPWSDFVNWKEDDAYIIIYHSDVLYNLIPKRFFEDESQVETLKGYLNENGVEVKNRFGPLRLVVWVILLLLIFIVLLVQFILQLSPDI